MTRPLCGLCNGLQHGPREGFSWERFAALHQCEKGYRHCLRDEASQEKGGGK